MKRVLYVQYTNPAGYPPLQHSSQILAEHGWEVLFLGTGALGTGKLRFSPDPRIQVRQLRFQKAGWRQKIHYLFFLIWCLTWLLRWRPDWVYASDMLASPFAWLAIKFFRVRVLFHEHDSPSLNSAGLFTRICLWTRAQCGRRATLCVLPNAGRAERWMESTGSSTPPLVVWNCPRPAEVAPARTTTENRSMRVLYHGSIVPERLPLTVIEAVAGLPDGVRLTVVGYETTGSRGYVEYLRARAAELGIETRLEFIPGVSRTELMSMCPRHDVGLALMPLVSDDLNLRSMTGASNKAFDYLAGGLALVVSSLPDWESMFVQPGYGVACDPQSVQGIQEALRSLYHNPRETRAMGERGRLRILAEWNYDRQFQPVLERLSEPFGPDAVASKPAPRGMGQAVSR